MALGNNNTAGLGDDFKKMYERYLGPLEPYLGWGWPPSTRPVPPPVYKVPNGATSYYGSPRGPGCENCNGWLTEVNRARRELDGHIDYMSVKRAELAAKLLQDINDCVIAYKDSIFPVNTIGYGLCASAAQSSFNKAVSELEAANAPRLARLQRAVAQAEEAAKFWCSVTGWPVGGIDEPRLWYPVPPPPPVYGSEGD